jgi:uncharacterized protein YndB with AHSA1/START domain
MQFNWTTFTKRISIKVPAAAIYNAWATPGGLESWFLRRCIVAHNADAPVADDMPMQKGNCFTWYWHGWPDEVHEKGEILFANGTDTLSFTFGQQGAEGMICTIKIYEEEGETVCGLVQENIPVDERGKSYFFVGCNTGWTFYMANLKSILEGGIDLRNKNAALKNVLNA